MTAAAVITADAGSVEMALPAGSGAGAAFPVAVNSSGAGSVLRSTRASRSSLPSAGSGAAARDGCMVTTICAGSVAVDSPVSNVDTSRAGSVKISFTDTQAMPLPATGAGDNGQEGATVSWRVAAATAAALDLLDLANCTAHGDKLRAFLVVIAGAAEVYARGAFGRTVLYASVAILLLGLLASCSWL